MPINGKQWSAIIVRRPGLIGVNGIDDFTETLYYNSYTTTPAEIAGYYPTLSWDTAAAVTGMTYIRSRWLPWNDPPFLAYDSDEDAMLDTDKFAQPFPINLLGYNPIGNYRVLRYHNGVWRTDGMYSGSPSFVWSTYPLTPLEADTTVTPFGAYGNGLIKYQLLFTEGPVFTEIDDPPPNWETDPDQSFNVGVVDVTYIFTPTSGSGVGGPDGEGDGLQDDDITVRVWGFSLDGHDFYVLRLGQSETLVYDLTTGTWSSWKSPARGHWRAHVGCNWPGMSSVQPIQYGITSDVICGDDVSNMLFTLDPTSGRDDRSNYYESDYFMREVTAGVRASGREVVDCGAVTLDATVGEPTQDDAFITLEISDDLGETWTNCGSITVTDGDYDAIIEWRGLGQIKHPGRLFRLTDNGATFSIGALELR